MSSFLEDFSVELSQNYFCVSKSGSMPVIQDLLPPTLLIQSINKHKSFNFPPLPYLIHKTEYLEWKTQTSL